MIQSSHIVRIAIFLFLNGALMYSAWRAAGALLKREDSAGRAVAAFAIYFFAAGASVALPGFAGALAIRPVAIVAVAAAFALLAVCRRVGRQMSGTACEGSEPLSLPVKIFAALTIFALGFMALWSVATPPPPGGDGYIYHLFFPATWLQEGRIGYVALPYGAQAATYYPLNTELFYAWLMLPLHEDFMTNTAQLLALAALAAAVYSIAKRLGAGRSGAMLGACCAVLLPGMVQQAGVARVDIFFALWFAAALYFIYAWADGGGAGELVMLGLCWGLFVGTKTLGAVFSVCLVPLFIWAASKRGAKGAAFGVLAAFALIVISGGFWYLRNWELTGNPLYPLNVAVGGTTVFAGAYGGGAMKAFHTSDPRELLRIGRLFIGYGPAALMALGAAGAFAGVAMGGREGRGRALYALLLPAAILLIFWRVNPHNNLTNGRFLFPAFALACLYPALAAGRVRTFKPLEWLAPAAFIAVLFQPGSDHLARMATDLSGALAGRGGGLLSASAWALRIIAAALLASAVCALILLKNRKTKTSFGAYIAGAMTVLLLAAGMNAVWSGYGPLKYRWIGNAGIAGAGWRALDERVRGGAAIANVGNERAYPLFGSGLRNRVVMVNVDGHYGWQYHDYERAARRAGIKWDMNSERPQLHRDGADPDAWIANLRRAGVQLIYCTDLEPIALRFMRHTPDGFPLEVQWMRERPRLFRRVFSLRGGGPGDTHAVEIYAFNND